MCGVLLFGLIKVLTDYYAMHDWRRQRLPTFAGFVQMSLHNQLIQ